MNVDGVYLDFPSEWLVEVYDTWSFVRNRFNGTAGTSKAVDIVARDTEKTLWLIEVKDYRVHRRTKTVDLAEEVAKKARDTLAGVFAASVNAVTPEKTAAQSLVKVKRMRVVLQLEQPAKHSKLFPRAIDPSKVQQQLKRLVKSIDAHPVITSSIHPHPGIEWTAS